MGCAAVPATPRFSYVSQSPPPVYYPHLAMLPDEDRAGLSDDELQAQANKLDGGHRKSAIEGRLRFAQSHTMETMRSHLSSLGACGKELDSLAEGNFQLKRVQEFSRFGLVPPEIFDDLARREGLGKRRFAWTPAIVARRYACKIVRVSESWASRKSVRK